ncbi:MAG: 3-dehydroquinate synthase [bacterium]|nr:3-dehydroquinate synthase [bacterium]
MKTLHVELGERDYNILIGSGILDNSPEAIKKVLRSSRVVVITDSNVSRLYEKKILELLTGIGLDISVFEIDHGERSKNIDVVMGLCRSFAEISLDRRSSVIALGGGVVGDIAGFAASIYMRGVDFIQIPTTLLSACDSSVGGKVGINLDKAKNLIGAFHQPALVIIDPQFLPTLPRREMISGLGEVIKTGLISSRTLYDKIKKHLKNILTLDDQEIITEVILDCVDFKADIVKGDEKESGLRRILNFGHTIGHGIEAVLQTKGLLHGEAVVFGMQCSIYLSKKRNMISDQLYFDIRDMLLSLDLPDYITDPDFNDIITFIRKDKKVINNSIHFVLLEDVGKPVICDDVTDVEIQESFEFVKELYK